MVATVALRKIPEVGVTTALQSLHTADVEMLLPKISGFGVVVPKIRVFVPSQEVDVGVEVAAPVPAY